VSPNGNALTQVATSPVGFAIATFDERVEQLDNTQ